MRICVDLVFECNVHKEKEKKTMRSWGSNFRRITCSGSDAIQALVALADTRLGSECKQMESTVPIHL